MINTENIIAGQYCVSSGKAFSAQNPSTAEKLGDVFHAAEPNQADAAVEMAAGAFNAFKSIPNTQKALFLRTIADELEAIAEQLYASAIEEAGLTEARMKGELARTTGQLRMFAEIVEEGSWVDAVITTPLPERKPGARPDLRRMLVPLGSVVVFGASNFPLAFSVAGGDTAAALAVGSPVIVKAHPAHPATSALAGSAILRAISKNGLPGGIFSLLFDDGYEIGSRLVKHPLTKAVAFTGSLSGGMALHKLAQERPEPIPVFAEMGSLNPVVMLPEAIETRASEIASKYAFSITNSAGQFCTKPGLMIAIESEGLREFRRFLTDSVHLTEPATMLTPGIFESYRRLSAEALMENGVKLLTSAADHTGVNHHKADAIIAEVSAEDFLKNPRLSEEVFGPYSLLVVAKDTEELEMVGNALQGQLTITIMASEKDVNNFYGLITELQNKTGRLVFNGVPTGVEVCGAINHGGPFPATNNQFTSVGSAAINRFVRPLAWQDWPDALLPDALKASNPLNIYRKVDNNLTKDGF